MATTTSNSPLTAREDGVGGVRTADLETLTHGPPDRGDDLLFFLALAEQAVLAGVGVDATHRDPHGVDAQLRKGVVRQCDSPADALRIDEPDRFDQTHVNGHEDHVELGRREHHGKVGGAGVLRQDLGVTGKVVPPQVQRLLVQGGGADRIDRALPGQVDGLHQIAKGGVAGRGRQAPGTDAGRQQVEIETIDRAEPKGGLVGRVDRPDHDVSLGDGDHLVERLGIADDDGPAGRVHRAVGKRLDDDLGPDAGRVAHRYADDRAVHALSLSPQDLIGAHQHAVFAKSARLGDDGHLMRPDQARQRDAGFTSLTIRIPLAPRRSHTALAVAPPVSMRPPTAVRSTMP